MKEFVFTLLIVALISGCGILGDDGSDAEDPFEPFTVGSFHFDAPDHAYYIGVVSNKIKLSSVNGDTVEIKSPDDYSFSIEKGEEIEDPNVYRIKFLFIDSTQKDRSNHDYTSFYSPAGALYGVNSRLSISDDRLEAKFGINVNCTTYNKITNYPHVFFKSSYDETLKVYRIHVDSIIETINLFTDCQ